MSQKTQLTSNNVSKARIRACFQQQQCQMFCYRDAVSSDNITYPRLL